MLRFVVLAVDGLLSPVNKGAVVAHRDGQRVGDEVGLEALTTRLGVLSGTHIIQFLVHAKQHLINLTILTTVIDECHLRIFNRVFRSIRFFRSIGNQNLVQRRNHTQIGLLGADSLTACRLHELRSREQIVSLVAVRGRQQLL